MTTPTKKHLSAGVMNLKFMMRAADAAPAPALEKKKVVDEGEWDIGPEARRALGITSTTPSSIPETPSSQPGSSDVSYETSYMPFITSAPPKGRFSFKDGLRREHVAAEVPVDEGTSSDTEDEKERKKSPEQPFRNTKAISHQKPPKKSKRPSSPQPPSATTASTSARGSSSSADPSTITAMQQRNQAPQFLKPAGVDAHAGPKSKKRLAEDTPRLAPSSKQDSAPTPSTSISSTPQKKKKKKDHDPTQQT
ncbi:hypothetical protein DL93DRAFT_1588602 [Clavulina sp. PMI_390]|nr:hypothetical protein DL93DRAFT_1588602 [Clavulina sp. PMI_390]